MVKDWKQIDLSKATIFDLTDDIPLIRQALNDDEFTQEELPVYLRESPRYFHVLALYSYAEITDDEPLYRAIEKANPDMPPIVSDVRGVNRFE